MNAEDGEDAALAFGDRERGPARIDSGPDRDHAFDACFSPASKQLFRRHVAPVEVRVGVDHATAVSSSTRGKRGSAGTIPSADLTRPYATPSHKISSDWRSATSIRCAVSGRYAASAIATARRPSARS